MNACCGRSLAELPPRVQCLGVFLGSGMLFSLAALLVHREDPTFAASWLQFLLGALLVHALTFLFFVDAVERQAALFVQYVLRPNPLQSHLRRSAMTAAEVEAVLLADPLEPEPALPAPPPDAAVWRTISGKAVLAVFGILSLGLTLTAAVVAFPAARDLAHDAVTMPGALAVLALLGGGALAAQRLRTGQTMDANRTAALREALAAVFGTLDWQAPATATHVTGRTVMVRKERQEVEGRAVRGVVVSREEVIQGRSERLARVELLLDPASRSHRTLLALLRLACGVRGLPQDAVVLDPLGIGCTAAGDCHHRGRELSHQAILGMTMRLAQHLLREDG
ncbi:hypothetical protein [Megalodesulfovibrio gigas]|uniref:Uncharacterized protein n=1 Tax=Megalodesulfovibrio gigas (strain ATCC 19364 / DSM 1382 / NCIMB 9332 / VKM B-1759) TaxID=1121448 RepID=T2G735_MEGG1|nr:hypothetical protein [Megalodesulfovibrio gigas]AGW12410.1 hypothetical protein DGI_0501 [Megalodesulfovibrio gigas DSM 1382 = ATCC 19364]